MPVQSKDKRAVEKDARKRGRVLLIADEAVASEAQALKAMGLEVVDVASGAAAMISLQRARPHVAIASTSAKGVSAGELVRMLSQSQDRIPLVLIGTEAATKERRLSALSLGAFDFFQVPGELALLLERTKQLVAQAQAMERLRAEADLDPLTGLANRRRFRVALNGEVERWRRYGVPCALLLLDIDYMKKINDEHGHTAGDAVIRRIADTLIAASRDNDTAARVGGEEFALLLAGVPGEKAQVAAERLRKMISDLPVEGVGVVTVSIGVGVCPANANSERTLYAASDGALYVAKNEGRNRVAVAPLMQGTLPGLSVGSSE
jgi:diguanylate cyclase (GGDEF)-like protein